MSHHQYPALSGRNGVDPGATRAGQPSGDPPGVAAAACAAAVGLHLLACALVPDLAIHPIQTLEQRIVLVRLAPASSAIPSLPEEMRLPRPALGIATVPGSGGAVAAPTAEVAGSIAPDPSAPADATVAPNSAGSAEAGPGAGEGVGDGAGFGAGPGSGGGSALGFVLYDQRPVLLHFEPVPAPSKVSGRRVKGTVLVSVLVAVSGRVEDARVVESVDPILDRQALLAARGCRFRPGRQAGVPVPTWVTLSYRFGGR